MKDSAAPIDLTFAIVGAGRVGVSIGVLLKRAGYDIAGAASRSQASGERAARFLEMPVSDDYEQAAKGAGCVIISVPDDAVEKICRDLADAGAIEAGTFVIHTAGSFGTAPLAEAEARGARTLAIHPLQSIPDPEAGIERLPGSWFGITCTDDLRPWAEALVADLGGRPLWVREEDRPAYHLAAVMASNFLVTLAGMVDRTAGSMEAYLPLMKATLTNVEQLGPQAALTGPIARGDLGTIRTHLRTLRERGADIEAFYRALTRITLDWAVSIGRLDEERADAIRVALEEEPIL